MGFARVIVLDTNVISVLASPRAATEVVAWADAQRQEDLYTTAIGETEMLYGIALLPPGRRWDDLKRAVMTVFASLLAGRVLPSESAAAACFADWAVARRQAGKPAGMADLQIAAIARARNVTAIATRNIRDFEGYGVPLVNSWGV